jgi:hypothetical protein
LEADFNKLLEIPLYDTDILESVFVRFETKKRLDQSLLGGEIRRNANRMLLEDALPGILKKRALVPRKVVTKSLTRDAPTEPFKAIFNSEGKFAYFRHHAFRPHFTRIAGVWYLEITPTYHYTWDGFRVSRYYEDLIKGIKRQERSGAVFRLVMFWARVLQDKRGEFFGENSYPYLQFGNLKEFSFDYGINDDAWMKKEVVSGNENEIVLGQGRGRRKIKVASTDAGLFDNL